MAGDELQTVAKAGADALFAPVRDTIARIAGPFADELGGILGDRLRVFRYKQSLRLFQKVKAISEGCGIELKSVPLKTLLPIVENASLEDDEDLHDRWANLLANAANPNGSVHPSFPQILQSLTGSEARFLDAIFERIFTRLEEEEHSPDRTQRDLFRVGLGAEMNRLYYDAIGLTENDEIDLEAAVALDNFRRLQLIEGPFPGRPHIELTSIGFAFGSAIRKPEYQRD